MKTEETPKLTGAALETAPRDQAPQLVATWREAVPVLRTKGVTLREIRPEDAPALLVHLGTPEVSRFMATPMTSIEGFERLIMLARQERIDGQAITFGVVPDEADHVIGCFQLKALEVGFGIAEWSFAIGSAYWGSGVFLTCARVVLDFAFESLRVVRLEARAVTMDGRGNGALRKIGAVQEGVLRRAFTRHGQRHDQLLWAMLAEDWEMQKRGRPRLVH